MFCWSLFQISSFAFSYNNGLAKQTPMDLMDNLQYIDRRTSEPRTYLEPSQTSTMELFCEIIYRVLAVNYFRKKAPS